MEEQWLRMGKAAKVLHGREHCVPAADSTHTQLLQVPHVQDEAGHDPCIITSVVAKLSSDGEANCKIIQHQY